MVEEYVSVIATTCLVDVRFSQGSIRMPRTSFGYNKECTSIYLKKIPVLWYNFGICQEELATKEKVIGRQNSQWRIWAKDVP